MQHWRVDNLISCHSNNLKLTEGLKLVKPRPTTGSLAAYDNFQADELHRFMLIYNLEVEDTITGCEWFPGEMMPPRKLQVNLPDEIYNLLVEYYKNAYGLEFVTIAGSIRSRRNNPIVVRPQVNQFGRIRIGAEIFGSSNTPRYIKNSFILAKFIQNDDSIEVFPGQVQYFFEHEVNLPGKKEMHQLAYVKWFMPVPDHRKRFHFQINNDIKSCNVEIWTKDFCNIDRDCIIPVHNILSRFIPSEYVIGRRNPIIYMAVIPIGRKYHI